MRYSVLALVAKAPSITFYLPVLWIQKDVVLAVFEQKMTLGIRKGIGLRTTGMFLIFLLCFFSLKNEIRTSPRCIVNNKL